VEAARRIRTLPHGEHVRIVALTGWGQEADRQRTRDAGMDYHLTKPVSLDALQSVLGALDPS
jgi:CheY-like chemotaxis protein